MTQSFKHQDLANYNPSNTPGTTPPSPHLTITRYSSFTHTFRRLSGSSGTVDTRLRNRDGLGAHHGSYHVRSCAGTKTVNAVFTEQFFFVCCPLSKATEIAGFPPCGGVYFKNRTGFHRMNSPLASLSLKNFRCASSFLVNCNVL